MNSYQIIDTGPLVSLLTPNELYHHWVKEQYPNTSSALLTCEAVLAEAAHFLSKTRFGGLRLLVDFVNSAPIHFPFSYAQNRTEVRELIEKYGDVPMSFADACLVRISELYPDAHYPNAR